MLPAGGMNAELVSSVGEGRDGRVTAEHVKWSVKNRHSCCCRDTVIPCEEGQEQKVGEGQRQNATDT